MNRAIFAAVAASLLGCPLQAQNSASGWELSFYLGVEEADASRVKGTGGSVDGDNFLIDWEGKSFDAPPVYGVRATFWRDAAWGYGLDINHLKAYAPDPEAFGYDRLELTDGHNIATLNGYHRWPGAWGSVTPYIGGGIGIAVPHVDVTKGASRTYEYQLSGPAASLLGGVRYGVGNSMSLFVEYKAVASINELDMEDGGQIDLDLVTHSINVGLNYAF